MESREMVLMSPLQGRSGDAGIQVGLVDTGRAGRGKNGERSISTHTARCETASGREGSVAQGPSPVLWDDGEGWGWVGGRLQREGIHIYIYIIMAVSHHCMAKNNTILKQFSSN